MIDFVTWPPFNAASDWPRTFFTPRVFLFSLLFTLATIYRGLTFRGAESTMRFCAYRKIYRIITFKLRSNIFALISTLNYTKNIS